MGRDSKSDVYLNHRAVSRRHAQLVVTHDRVEVTDLESHNGTFINEKRVKSSELQLGENVRFGAIKLVLIRKDPHDSSDDSTHTIRQYNFTAAHLRVLELLKKGLSEKKIAAALDLSPHTVHNHVREIYRICDVHSRAELFRKLFPQDTEEI